MRMPAARVPRGVSDVARGDRVAADSRRIVEGRRARPLRLAIEGRDRFGLGPIPALYLYLRAVNAVVHPQSAVPATYTGLAASDKAGSLTLECRLALVNLFFTSLGEAGFVRGFFQRVEFALVQPHGPVRNGARDGGETFFHEAHRTESWRAPDYTRLRSTLQTSHLKEPDTCP